MFKKAKHTRTQIYRFHQQRNHITRCLLQPSGHLWTDFDLVSVAAHSVPAPVPEKTGLSLSLSLWPCGIPWLFSYPYITYIPCICHVYAMYMPCICHVYAMYMPCICHVYAMYMPCICHVYAMYTIWLIWPLNVHWGNPFYPQSLGSQVGHFSGHPDYASSGNWG